MKLLIALSIAVVATLAYSQPSGLSIGRYMIVSAKQGDSRASHAVFRLDTVTGSVSYCVPSGAPGSGNNAVGVVCVDQVKAR